MNEASRDDVIQVWFRFQPREGWLPQDTEALWARPLSRTTALVENPPFLQDGVAAGDVIRFETDDNGVHWARERMSTAGHCVVRVLPTATGPLGPHADAVHSKFAPLALNGESFSEDFPLVTFDVPADADFPALKQLLADGTAGGWWQFEIGCASDEFWAA